MTFYALNNMLQWNIKYKNEAHIRSNQFKFKKEQLPFMLKKKTKHVPLFSNIPLFFQKEFVFTIICNHVKFLHHATRGAEECRGVLTCLMLF